MGRMYSAQFNGSAATAQVDFFELNAPSTASLVLHRVEITQSTEAGDAQDEMLTVLIKRGATTSGSGGATPTAAELFSSAAFGGTVETMNTTKATAGTIVTLYSAAFNVRAGFLYVPTPEERIVIAPSGRLTVELATTPADSITFNGTIVFEALS